MGLIPGGVSDADRAALEDFVVENRELDRLEVLLAKFNVFEALGTIRRSCATPTFWRSCSTRGRTTASATPFLGRLLQKALRAAPIGHYSISPIDVDVWNRSEAQVQREWHNIDIFVRDDAHRLAVMIQNKVGTGEHSGQLERYQDTVVQQYPGWRVVGLFLTPEGIQASSRNYAAVSYSTVCSLVDELVESRGPSFGDDVRIVLLHYNQMLRRHTVSDSDIAELCRRIYRKHQRALDESGKTVRGLPVRGRGPR